VKDPAVLEAEKLLRCMMQATPAAVLRRLQEAQCQVAIIGRQQVTTDIPAHHFMKHCKGRDIDGTTRGLGGTAAIPVTSCGEENLTMVGDRCVRVGWGMGWGWGWGHGHWAGVLTWHVLTCACCGVAGSC
jgi:hypothetical protein